MVDWLIDKLILLPNLSKNNPLNVSEKEVIGDLHLKDSFMELKSESLFIFISALNTGLLLFNPQAEVPLDEGLSFFVLSGEEDSAIGQSAEQVGFVPPENIGRFSRIGFMKEMYMVTNKKLGFKMRA